MGGVLDKFGYNPNLDVQPASALTGMKFLMTVVPISAMVLALLIFSHYPLDGEKLAEVRSKIAAVRKEQAGD
jgi:Na+/melibiose symporter-like transporter